MKTDLSYKRRVRRYAGYLIDEHPDPDDVGGQVEADEDGGDDEQHFGDLGLRAGGGLGLGAREDGSLDGGAEADGRVLAGGHGAADARQTPDRLADQGVEYDDQAEGDEQRDDEVDIV